jgi:hypothetical protein
MSKRILAYILLAVVVIGGGCMGTMSEELTPGRIDPRIVNFNVESGVADANDYDGFLYPSLATLRKLQRDFEAAKAITKQELEHMIEQKLLELNVLQGTLDTDVELAEAREDWAFNPTTGAIVMGLSLMGVAGGGLVGAMRKRPQDVSPEEMEKIVGDIKGDVDEKDRQILNLVASVKNVLEDMPTEESREAMKKTLKAAQLPDTRVAVKEALAKL